MKKKPLVSVVVPVYNVEKYLPRCMNSLIHQSYSNLQIILVDDGSTDSSGIICDKYSDKDARIQVIHKQNGGLSSARNAAIPCLKGNYVAFVDSDDWVDHNMIHDMLAVSIRTGCKLVFCDPIRVKTEGKTDTSHYDKHITIYSQKQFARLFFKIGTNRTVIYAHSKLYARELIEEDLYPEGLTSEDVVGTLKAFIKADKIAEIHYPYYYYFINPGSITGHFSRLDFDLIPIWNQAIRICRDRQPEYEKYAVLNRKRIDFTLLTRLAVNLPYDTIMCNYRKETAKLLADLKANKLFLLRENIPASRKICIVFICRNYPLFCKAAYQLASGWRKIKG